MHFQTAVTPPAKLIVSSEINLRPEERKKSWAREGRIMITNNGARKKIRGRHGERKYAPERFMKNNIAPVRSASVPGQADLKR